MVEMHKVVEYIAGRSGLNAGAIYNVLHELHACLAFHTQSSYSVRLEGLGTEEKSFCLSLKVCFITPQCRGE